VLKKITFVVLVALVILAAISVIKVNVTSTLQAFGGPLAVLFILLVLSSLYLLARRRRS